MTKRTKKKGPVMHIELDPKRLGNLRLDLRTFVTGTQAILAQKGKGKSHLAQVQAEELLAADQQIVAVDPTGAWWGLRSSKNGKKAGYPVVVFGGEHADVELEATAGEVIAEAIATEHFSAVIDLTLFRKMEALRFMAAFLETLYRKNREALHLFIDEADVIAPQKTFSPEQARCLGAAEDIVRRGRIRGIGCTLISQRAQVINKDVLALADMLTTLGMNHPRDLAAIDEWVRVHGDANQAKTMNRSLPSLPTGDAWFWSPSLNIFELVTIRDKRTYDSGRTPKAGERRAAPKVMAKVDIKALGVAIAETVQRKVENDPTALKARIAELEKASRSPASTPGKTTTVYVDRPDAKAMRRLEGMFAKLGPRLAAAIERVNVLAANMHDLQDAIEATRNVNTTWKKPKGPTPSMVIVQGQGGGGGGGRSDIGVVARQGGGGGTRSPTTKTDAGTMDAVKNREMAVLEGVAWWASIGVNDPITTAVAFASGYSPTSTSFEKARGILRNVGLITFSNGRFGLTDAGRLRAPVASVPLTHNAMMERVRSMLANRECTILGPVVRAWPNRITQAEVAAESGYSVTSTSYQKARGILRTYGLIDYHGGELRAADLLFPGGRR